MPTIQVIEPKDAQGKLKEIYDDLIKSRGKIANVHKIQSLNPESIVAHMDLYMAIMFKKSPLRRVQREMIAVVVSMTNNCEYCQIHHLEAVKHFWKDDAKAEMLKKDFHKAELSAIDLALCQYAVALTKHPESDFENTYIKSMKELELSDRAILDATLVISYFNFVNRIVLSLGVDIEENAGGYQYD